MRTTIWSKKKKPLILTQFDLWSHSFWYLNFNPEKAVYVSLQKKKPTNEHGHSPAQHNIATIKYS